MKTIVATIILVTVLAGLGYAWFWYNEGVSHAELHGAVQNEGAITREAIGTESREIQGRIDNRFQKTMKKLEGLETKLEGVEAKLTSVDEKLDRILQLADRPAVDGMEVVK